MSCITLHRSFNSHVGLQGSSPYSRTKEQGAAVACWLGAASLCLPGTLGGYSPRYTVVSSSSITTRCSLAISQSSSKPPVNFPRIKSSRSSPKAAKTQLTAPKLCLPSAGRSFHKFACTPLWC